MTTEESAPKPTLKLSLDDWLLIDDAGKLVAAAQERLQATPEFRLLQSAQGHFAKLNERLGVPPNVLDFKGELDMVLDPRRPGGPVRPDMVLHPPPPAKTPEELRAEGGVPIEGDVPPPPPDEAPEA